MSLNPVRFGIEVVEQFGPRCSCSSTARRKTITEIPIGASASEFFAQDRYRRCVECNSRNITFDCLSQVTIKTLPIGSKKVFLVLHLRVLKCRDCGAKRQESRDVADSRKSYTRQFARYVLDLRAKGDVVTLCTLFWAGFFA